MKKQNVLDFLCDDFMIEFNEEHKYIDKVFTSDEDYIKLYKQINIFLINNQKLYNLDFEYNINSSDDLTKAKSLYLLNSCIRESINLIGVSYSFYKHYETEYDKFRANDEMCYYVLLGNILDYKQEMSCIKEKNCKDYIERFKKLYDKVNDEKEDLQ